MRGFRGIVTLISFTAVPLFAAPQPDSHVDRIAADIIVTAAPVYVPRAELRGEERFPKGAHLLLVRDGKAEPLIPEFAASADANVYFDGSRVIFSGKQKPGDPWQIWELSLKDHSLRHVLTTASDAERPLYLPAGRVVFGLRTPGGFRLDSNDDGHPLLSTPLNPTTGPGEMKLAYTRGSSFPDDVLQDGRVLFESNYPLGNGQAAEMFLVYPDGSGVESYRCDHGVARWAGEQSSSGDVVFTHGDGLARFTSPLAHEVRIAAPPGQYAGSIAEAPSGEWLVSVRQLAGMHYVLKLWKPGTSTMRTELAESTQDLVEPVLAAPRTMPTRFPSGLHPWDYANLLALDARLSRDGVLKGTPARVRLEAQDADGKAFIMGTAPVEQDGSFFIQVPGDRPLRISLLDAKGSVLRQEHGWFWSRGGEQRICVGCHTGPERSSDNRVPAVLLRTTTPVALTAVQPASSAHRVASGGR